MGGRGKGRVGEVSRIEASGNEDENEGDQLSGGNAATNKSAYIRHLSPPLSFLSKYQHRAPLSTCSNLVPAGVTMV